MGLWPKSSMNRLRISESVLQRMTTRDFARVIALEDGRETRSEFWMVFQKVDDWRGVDQDAARLRQPADIQIQHARRVSSMYSATSP